MLPWLLALAGLVGLVFGSDLAVDSGRAIARRFGVSTLVIGLTLTSVGTSLPEIATNLAAGWSSTGGTDASGLAVGNIIGSNLSQITLLLGIVGLVQPLVLGRRQLFRDGGALLVALVAMWITCLDGQTTRTEGLVLVGLYAVYMLVLLVTERGGRGGPEDHEELEPHAPARPIWAELGRVALGLALVVVCADQLVKNGVIIARGLGVSDLIIGFGVGIGTSLPELTVALRGLQKGAAGMSIGNLIGSNVTDPLLSYGLGASLHAVTVDRIPLVFDFPYWLACTVLALLFLLAHGDLDRKESAALIVLFCLHAWLRVGVFG